ncbi:hypothetical protein Barb6_02794 [Bacteroidales bacterium Barb6]|nr:hypothetical protein Barb6_02794 [Bacteroidales bacterium Barb6]
MDFFNDEYVFIINLLIFNNMQKNLFLVLLFSAALFGCSKDDETGEIIDGVFDRALLAGQWQDTHGAEYNFWYC